MGKYEEALERARQGKPIDEVFPELKESEDERIRKALVKEFKEKVQKSFVWKGIPNNAILNWLEKQKEQKPILKFKVGDKIHLIDGTSPNYEDDCITIREIDTVNYIGEFKEGYVPIKEQDKWELVKEQKPTITIDQLKSFMLQYLQDAANRKDDSEIEADTDKWAKKILEYSLEQKVNHLHPEDYPMTPKECIKPSEWSEEDEMMLTSVVDALALTNGAAQMKIDWLKRLKDRVFIQSKSVGWSNEDLKMIGIAISFIEQVTACNYILGVNKLDVIAWLKALRSGTIHKGNPHWKPSEEQMEALRRMKAAIAGEGEIYIPLNSLYDDLKKLM